MHWEIELQSSTVPCANTRATVPKLFKIFNKAVPHYMLSLVAVLWRRGGFKIDVASRISATSQTFKEIQQSTIICCKSSNSDLLDTQFCRAVLVNVGK